MAEMFLDTTQTSASANQNMMAFNRGRPNTGQYKCPRCGNGYTYRKNMLRHVNLECGKEPRFQCPYCPKKAKHKNHILTHMKSQHPGHM